MAVFKTYWPFHSGSNKEDSEKMTKVARVFCDGTGDHLFYFVGCGCCDMNAVEDLEKEIVKNNFKKVTVLFTETFFSCLETQKKIFMFFIKGSGVEYNEMKVDPRALTDTKND